MKLAKLATPLRRSPSLAAFALVAFALSTTACAAATDDGDSEAAAAEREAAPATATTSTVQPDAKTVCGTPECRERRNRMKRCMDETNDQAYCNWYTQDF